MLIPRILKSKRVQFLFLLPEMSALFGMGMLLLGPLYENITIPSGTWMDTLAWIFAFTVIFCLIAGVASAFLKSIAFLFIDRSKGNVLTFISGLMFVWLADTSFTTWLPAQDEPPYLTAQRQNFALIWTLIALLAWLLFLSGFILNFKKVLQMPDKMQKKRNS